MSIDAASGEIRWRLHLKSSPEVVYRMLDTAEGRAKFWGESAIEREGFILFTFPNGLEWAGRILDRRSDQLFSVDYFGSRVTFDLEEDGQGGTDLLLTDYGPADDERIETFAGWVSVLLTLKAAVDHGIDLRNHDPQRTWDQGYVDN